MASEFGILERKSRCCYFIGQAVSDLGSTASIMTPIFEEIFIDLIQSISACIHSQYRSAYQSLRSALELSVAVVYFADHPIEFSQWKNDTWDFQFSMLREILSENYANTQKH
ncbi:hypothetical protein [Desulfolucanica intricata]|uniref:hypothetical protein n=1 Tax=Desulfolucanica intricata TaxID=1285191 RepID=UPI000B2C5AF2|nr:hypothetical protein [Desulfolucanica intricata]